MDTQQETIIATRNAITRTTALSQNSGTIIGGAIGGGYMDEGDGGGGGGMDPLAQTFIVLDTDTQDEGTTGAFLTSCDIFFFEM